MKTTGRQCGYGDLLVLVVFVWPFVLMGFLIITCVLLVQLQTKPAD